jgi:membrane protease YdiL (CAAX protease family)
MMASEDPQLPPVPQPEPGNAGRALPSLQRTWPTGRPLATGEALASKCGGCNTDWLIHHSMAGFRLRCDCGAWIELPAPALRLPMSGALSPMRLPAEALAKVPDAHGLLQLRVDHGATYDGAISTSLPMAPGTLQSGNVESRAAWTNRACLEFTAVLAAIIGPQLIAMWLTRGNEGVLLMPFVSLISGMLVLVIAAASGPYGTLGLRAPPFSRCLEALIAAPIGYVLAFAFVHLLRQVFLSESLADDFLPELHNRLGSVLAILVLAVSPAIIEEIAFRGMLQGRLMALLGARNGLLVTAMAFTLAHMSPLTMPIHLGLGLYLGFLRERSQSLLPGMLVHFIYNSMVVLLPI